MNIVGSVPRDKVPANTPLRPTRGVWPSLALRALRDYKQGRVTIVAVSSEDELKSVRKGVFEALRQKEHEHGMQLTPVINETSHGELRLYLKLEPKNGLVR